MKMHCVPFLSIEIYMTKSSMPNVPFMQFTFVAYVQFKHIFFYSYKGANGWGSGGGGQSMLVASFGYN